MCRCPKTVMIINLQGFTCSTIPTSHRTNQKHAKHKIMAPVTGLMGDMLLEAEKGEAVWENEKKEIPTRE